MRSGKLKGTVCEKRSKTISSSPNILNSTTRASISKLFVRQLLPTPNSTRHQDYGFGTEGRICIDIRGKSLLDSYPKAVIYRITPKGFSKINCVGENDIALMTCRNIRSPKEQKGKLHFERCCLDMRDIRDSAELYIDALYELDRHLGRIRRKDFIK